MAGIFQKRFILIAWLFFQPGQVIFANHSDFVFDLTYRWVSDSTYEITVVYFRPCQGASAPSSLSVSANSATTGLSSLGILHKLPTAGMGVPPLVIPNLFSCNPSPAHSCYEEHVYRGPITLQGRARDWIISHGLCCYSSLTFANVVAGTMWSGAGLNNLDFPDQANRNNSPLWHNLRPNIPGHMTDTVRKYPFLNVCAGRPVVRDYAAKEYQGDIVRYAVIDPLAGPSTPLGYLPPYHTGYPLDVDTPPSLWLDSVQGQLFFRPVNKPSSSQPNHTYLAAIRATEFRFDTNFTVFPPVVQRKYIGFVMRNLFITITADSLCPDTSFAFSNPSNPNVSASSLELECVDSIFEFSTTQHVLCHSADTNGSFILLLDSMTNFPVTVTGASALDCDHQALTQTIRLKTGTSLLHGRTYILLLKQGNDGNTLLGKCGTEIQPYLDTLTIRVKSQSQGQLLGHHLGNGTFTSEIYAECHAQALTLNFSTPVNCHSIESAGSDFYLHPSGFPSNSVAISQATAVNCFNDLTQTSIIHLANPIPSGQYRLKLKNGLDGNTVLNACGTAWYPDSISVTVNTPHVSLGNDTTFCSGASFNHTLHAGIGYKHYQWNTAPSDTFPQLLISMAGTYAVKIVTWTDCEATDTIAVTEISCPTGMEIRTPSRLRLYPNPADNEVSAEIPLEGGLMEIVDVSGRLYYQYKFHNNERLARISLGKFPEGLYLIRTQFPDGTEEISKLSVIHH